MIGLEQILQTMPQYELLIVGAGPAGSFAAELLATGGKRVALFDGRPEGEPKPCGGGVTAKALKAWPHLLDAVGRSIDELEMFSPSGRRIHLQLEEPFAIYSRSAFDTYLRDRAARAGAEIVKERISGRRIVRDGDSWSIKSADKEVEWRGRYLVGADGANSAIARQLAGPLPPAEMEVAFGYRAPLPPGAAPTVVAFLPDWVGYAWAFPRLDHISFGIATSQDAFAHEPLEQLLWKFMIGYYRMREDRRAKLWTSRSQDCERDRRLRRDLETSAERYAARIPGLAPATWDTRRACGEDWALLGDAAGFADPVTGEGIYYALRSAELFAQSYLTGEAAAYEERWREDFGAELQRASQMRRRFYGNFWGAPFTERMIEFARGHRGIRRVLGDLVAGHQGYVDLKRKLARSAIKPL